MEFSVTINIEADNKQQAGEKLRAFSELNALLSHDELVDISNLIQKKPRVIHVARKILDLYGDKESLGVIEAGRILTKHWSEIFNAFK